MSRVIEVHALKSSHPTWGSQCAVAAECLLGRARFVLIKRGPQGQTRRVPACAPHARDLAERDRVSMPGGSPS